jgi:hypothetical protein
MSTDVIARQDGTWIVVCLAPDVCLTPMGGVPVPVPYPVTATLGAATLTTTTVNVNDDKAVVFGSTFVPHTPGSEAGTLGGVMTGTTALNTRPLLHSSTVNFEGKPIVRDNDLYWMNGP